MEQETYYISYYDTFHNGLNESIDGKGNHLCDTFTTKGYTYSVESRRKMSESAKKRVERDGIPFKGRCHTEETKTKWSCIRKGRRWSPTKLKIEDVEYILNLYHNVKPILEGDDVLRKSGKPMLYDRAFATRYSKVFGVSLECILYIIRGKGWSDVQRKYTV